MGKVLEKVFWGVVITLIAASVVAIYSQLHLADKNHSHTSEEIYTALADGKYDSDYYLMNLAGSNPQELMQCVRPIAIVFFDSEGNPLGSTYGTATVMGNYVITNSILTDPRAAGIENVDSVEYVDYQLRPNVSIENQQDYQSVAEHLRGVYVNKARGFVVFERPEEKVFSIPECNLTVGSLEDLSPGNVLLRIGAFPLLTFSIYRDSVVFVHPSLPMFYFQGTVEYGDLGGPTFALRDGKFELIGMTLNSPGNYPVSHKIVAVSFENILEELKTVTGIDLLPNENSDQESK